MQHTRRDSISDEALIAVLYQQYAPELLTFIRRHVFSKEDAEDILFEVFLVVVENEATLKLSMQAWPAWLHRVAHNKIVDYHRRKVRRPSVALTEAEETLLDNEELMPERLAIRSEDHEQLRQHLATLSTVQQEVVRLRFVHGLRCSEIGKRLNKSDGAIRTLLSRTLNFLRNVYEKTEEENTHG